MTGQSSYRVYAADHSQSIAPTTLRRGEVTPKDGGLFGFGVLVVTVVVFISGASFAGQKLYDTQLAKSPRLAQARANEAAPPGGRGTAPSPFAMSLGAAGAPTTPTPPSPTAREALEAPQPPASVPTPAPVAGPVLRARVAGSDASRLRRTVQPRRVSVAGVTSVSSAPVAPASGALPSERGALAAAAEPVPPNPF